MRKLIFAVFLFSSIHAFSQDVTKDEFDKVIKPLNDKVSSLQSENTKLKKEVNTLSTNLSNSTQQTKALQKQVQSNTDAIVQTNQELGIKIQETGKTSEDKITAVDQSIGKKSLYGIIGVLLAILLSGVIYWLLSNRQKSDKSDVEGQISKTKIAIEEEQIQVNTKLAELYNGQMELLKAERTISSFGQKEVDHSLALKVADEIVKMQMNLIHMDSKIRGHKQLSIAVSNVFDNFKANGYEIIDHLNKPYNDGMNMDASKEPDPSLQENEQIIRRIIKPEIHFNNKMIQKAQVIVAYGE